MDNDATARSAQEIRNAITEQIDNPRQLEELYRKDPRAFAQAFAMIFPQISEEPLAQAWQARLSYRPEKAAGISRQEWIFMALAILAAGLVLKIPAMLSLREDSFYARNFGYAVFPMLTAFFAWKNGLSLKSMMVLLVMFIMTSVYINLLPQDDSSDTLVLACIHLPLLLWSFLSFGFLGDSFKNSLRRIGFLRYNGDLVVISALMTISAGLFTAITLGLFRMIGLDISQFYANYVVPFGAPAIPILGSLLIMSNPGLVNRISPLIARIFTPLVFVMLLFFLGAMIVTGKDPYNDRDFLLVFNLLLIGVMALILFSVTEVTKGAQGRIQTILLFGLSLLTAIVNGIALSAITFRLFEFGLTPNRLAVLGGNLLIMVHLLIVTIQLFKVVRGTSTSEKVEEGIGMFLPAYAIWSAIVVFGFPFMFGFK
jgi:hypothetical protein